MQYYCSIVILNYVPNKPVVAKLIKLLSKQLWAAHLKKLRRYNIFHAIRFSSLIYLLHNKFNFKQNTWFFWFPMKHFNIFVLLWVYMTQRIQFVYLILQTDDKENNKKKLVFFYFLFICKLSEIKKNMKMLISNIMQRTVLFYSLILQSLKMFSETNKCKKKLA